ncbi:uncharacterized protein LOC114342588 [Diabrotica virgifera virgifera]|uniref:Uncharacterized protein n=1 Tax=Diabrotica virgifera virgifera TaxID=50390 RepID=A0ABM5LAY9_DIAVI|nr:uncharacterized protein LOC114342588 [Diabrotica virgifera virgifera]
MFGSKLRSWMEAVRSRKKQHRKEKQGKSNAASLGQKNNVKWDTNCATVIDGYKENEREVIKSHLLKENQSQSGSSGVSNSRYSANNLSSPESAYSTGYSTDGTSPGAPPDNLLNTTKAPDICHPRIAVLNPIQNPSAANVKNPVQLPNSSKALPNHLKDHRTPIFKKRELDESKFAAPSRVNEKIVGNLSPALGITSPRQRNRIRTNPWLPGATLSPSPVKHGLNKGKAAAKSSKDSPKLRRFLSPALSRKQSLSTSSSSSLSATSIQLEVPRPKSVSDEDCTLNEMMGKYDESYVYEKETDILSDSDPTDCETDIDTGQDGGDEDEPFETELDFIDNGSFLDFEANRADLNTGHCSYYTYDVQRKRSSRRRTQRRNTKSSEKKRKSCSNKKKQSKQVDREKRINPYIDGSKSAGATPVSVRRANCRPISKLALDDCLRKRSNSVGFSNDPINNIDKRDKEADLKYRELISEAEHILRAMKTNGLSPRRVPGPANKRVELLRIAECAKPEVFVKNRPPEDTVISNPFCSKIPSNSGYSCPRFSPKKNHITKFIISNSPVLARKEWEMQAQIYKSPMSCRKLPEDPHTPQHVSLKDRHSEAVRSPKYRKKLTKRVPDSSSDSDEDLRRSFLRVGSCPQSEPVRRKVYNQNGGKTVAFNLSNEGSTRQECTSSSDNLRQQVLLNTIVNLKKNLEDHSASLKQVYRSSNNIYS